MKHWRWNEDLDSRSNSWGIWVKVPDDNIAVIDLAWCPTGGGGNPPQPPLPGEPAPPGSHYQPPAQKQSGIAVKRNDYNRDAVSDIVAVRDDCLHRWYGNGNGNGGFNYGNTYGCGWTPYPIR